MESFCGSVRTMKFMVPIYVHNDLNICGKKFGGVTKDNFVIEGTHKNLNTTKISVSTVLIALSTFFLCVLCSLFFLPSRKT